MEIKSIIIGGLIPALLIGVCAILMKLSLKGGISLPIYLSIVGGTIMLCGLCGVFFASDRSVNWTSTGWAMSMGATWALATYCMIYAVDELKLPVSVMAPLTNSNAIVAVIIGAIVFAEWKDLNMTKVSIGTVLTVIGATIVSTSSK